MAESANIDKLDIQIKTSASSASTALKKLAANFAQLRDTLSAGGIASGLRIVADSLTNMRTVASDTRSFASSIKALSTAMDKSVASMNRFDNAVMETTQIVATSVGQMRDLGVSFDTLSSKPGESNDQFSQLMETLDSLANIAGAAARNTIYLRTSFEEASDKALNLGNKILDVAKNEDTVSKTATAAAKSTAKVTRETHKLSSASSSAVNGLEKFISSLKRILMYRVIRTVIKNIGSAIKEGMQNLYDYSQTVGTAFAPAVDNLRQHVLLLKNAFATALRPVIESLIPIIIKLVDWLAKAADFIAQVISLLTGKVDANGRYTKAVLGDLQQSNKEAKALRRTLLGFDEINRLDGDSPSSSTQQTGGLMFEQAEVSEAAKKWAERLQKIIDKIKEIAKRIKKIIEDNPWILELAGWLLAAWGAAKLFGGAIDTVLGLVKGLLNPLTLVIAYLAVSAMWGDKIKEWLDKVREKVDAFFDKFKGHSAALDGAIDIVQSLIDFVLENIGLLSSAIYKLAHGDFSGAMEDIKQIGRNVLKFLVQIVGAVINFVLGIFSDLVNLIAQGVTWLHNKVWAPAINWLATAFKNIGIFFNNLWVDIRLIVVKGWKAIWGFLKEKFGDVIDSINDLIAWMNKTFNTDIKPIEFDTDTKNLDAEIERIEGLRLDPISETVEFVGQWRSPEKLKLQVDTSGLEAAIDNLGRKANRLGETLKSVNSNLRNSPNLGEVDFRHYASGGFPSVGSIYIAGEAGPEWVGDIGGRTGVMNTEQMASAMYQAVSAALANNPQGGGDIYLDGEVIYKNTVRRNNNRVRATGRSALLT